MTESSLAIDAPFDVAIMGGGASGALVTIHLLHATSTPLRIAIVEPRATLGQGIAYSTQYPEHLLNVIASRMSAFDSDPGHFVRFLTETHDGDVDDSDIGRRFARRTDFGRYLHATLKAAPRANDLRWLKDEAVDLISGDDMIISLKSGSKLRAQHVVLAIGNDARAIPLLVESAQGKLNIENAWDYESIRRIERDADVCIIGSGLSMVDVVMSLVECGHSGHITVLSRHGLMPLPHGPAGKQQGNVDDLLPLSMRDRLRIIHRRARESERNGAPWQWTMDALRCHGQALWIHSSPIERRRFLRHAARFWDIHRHRIAPQIADRLTQLRASGQLVVRPGHLLSVIGEGPIARVRMRPRGATHAEEIQVGYVINATGIETALTRTQRPLLKAMQASGMIQPGPEGIGIATDSCGAVIDHNGHPQPHLLALGALRIGELWESIAIPELRAQAAKITAHITIQGT